MEKNLHIKPDTHNIFERIIDSTHDAIYSNDLEGNVLTWNRAAETILGYSFEEIKSKSIFTLYPPEIVDEEFWFISCRQENKLVVDHETKRIKKDGTIIDISITVWPLKDDQNNLIGLSKIFHDITEHKYIAEKIEASEEKYKNLFEKSPLPMWVLDIPSLKFLDVNQMSVKHYGYSKEEFLRMTVYDIIPEHEIARAKNIDRSVENYQIPTKNWIHLKKSGVLIYVEVTSLEIMYNGKRARIVISQDVTERIESEEQIRELNQDYINTQLRYRAIIDHSLFAIFLSTPDGVLLEANPAATQMFGYTNDEFKLLHRDMIIDMTGVDVKQKLADRDLKGSIRGEFVGIKKTGERFNCEITSVIFKDYSGKLLSSNMISDISERKLSEERDRKIRASLEESQRIVYHEKALLQSIIDSPHDIFVVSINTAYQFTAFSEGYSRYLEKTIGRVPQIGFSIFDMVNEEYASILKKQYDRVLKGEYLNYERSLETLSGEKKYYENRSNPILGANGEILGLTIFIHEVTHHKKIGRSDRKILNLKYPM